MLHKTSIRALWVLIACVILALTGCDILDSSSDEEIARWADRYCRAANDFIQGFMVDQVQPSGDWEASYQFIQHYRRTIDAAEAAIRTLNAMDVPAEARSVHNTTIDVLGNVKDIAEDAIRDVENAATRDLFQPAIDRYATRLRDQARRLDDATQDASSRIRERLLDCLP
jgi:hypothetical protein